MDIKSVRDGFHTDFVFCIDATASMGPFLDGFRRFMPSFLATLKKGCEENDLALASARVRFVLFRDFGYDSQPLIESDFFSLPEDGEYMEQFLAAFEAEGGGDKPESVLEALTLARDSEWRSGPAVRQMILLFTDADPHPLGRHTYLPCYPVDMMPEDNRELREMWNQRGERGFAPNKLRLMLFCPEESSVWDYFDEWYAPCRFDFVDPRNIDEGYLANIIGSAPNLF